jgi:hypothetical protein
MANAPHKDKAEAIKAMRLHALEFGMKDFSAVRLKFPDVPQGTWTRWIIEVRHLGAEAYKGQHAEVSAKIVERVQKEVGAVLPRAPSPAVVEQLGAAGDSAFDFLEMFKQIVEDSMKLRDSTLKTMPDGSIRVMNPNMLDRNVQRRLQILETYMTAKGMIYNFDTIERLYRVVLEEIGKEDSQLQGRIMLRLQELNRTHGLTTSGHF